MTKEGHCGIQHISKNLPLYSGPFEAAFAPPSAHKIQRSISETNRPRSVSSLLILLSAIFDVYSSRGDGDYEDRDEKSLAVVVVLLGAGATD